MGEKPFLTPKKKDQHSKMMQVEKVPGSFRDPNGFLFKRDGRLLRQINRSYQKDYDHLVSSGLYDALLEDQYLIEHSVLPTFHFDSPSHYKTIQPTEIPFISYPYEWCFSQLREAALLTLKIQKKALMFSMTLKDASPYNIQFLDGKPIFVDTLSFERYVEGKPWVAYRQFCEMFFAPLILMSKIDVRVNRLLQVYLDGIPLELASCLLGYRGWFDLSCLIHIHLHAASQKRFAHQLSTAFPGSMSRQSMLGLIDSLEGAVRKLSWQRKKTAWSHYYDETNYSTAALAVKERCVEEFLDELKPQTVCDLGANAGRFARLATRRGVMTIACDLDSGAVEQNYGTSITLRDTKMIPLLVDLTNPSPGIGWENEERASLLHRGPFDAIFALALIHHWAIGHNTPLEKISHFLSKMGKNLLIEFIPKSDSQVKRLLATRDDIFSDYTEEVFRRTFSENFQIVKRVPIDQSERVLYIMKSVRENG